jgi:hypothetical protein
MFLLAALLVLQMLIGPPLVYSNLNKLKMRTCHKCEKAPGIVKHKVCARLEFLCAHCDHEKFFGAVEGQADSASRVNLADPSSYQDTLFYDREFFNGSNWQQLDRNQSALLHNGMKRRAVDLFVQPDRPCENCGQQQWMLESGFPFGAGMRRKLVIIDQGVREFSAAAFKCGSCAHVLQQAATGGHNLSYWPFCFHLDPAKPVTWIAIEELQRFRDQVYTFTRLFMYYFLFVCYLLSIYVWGNRK